MSPPVLFPDGPWSGSAISRAATVLLWLVVAFVVVAIARDNTAYQWDFRVFHAAPAALEAGRNPYDTSDAATGVPQGLSYLYPPVILYVFRPLAALPFEYACLAWLALKLVVLAGLLLLWHRHFERLAPSWPFVLMLAFGFNAALLRDLTAGNISVFEEAGLWLGFYFFVGRKPYLAGLCIAVVAQFKLLPIVFLALLLAGYPRAWKAFFASLAIFCALLSLNGLLLPDLTKSYIDALQASNPNLDERGLLNPASLAVMRDLTERATRAGIALPPHFAEASYLALVAALGALVLWTMRKYSAALRARDQRWIVYAACVLFVLTMPRVKDYTYIILLMPALFAVRRAEARYAVPLLAVLVLLPATGTYVPGITVFSWLQGYAPWCAAWFLLFMMMQSLRQRMTDTDQRPGPNRANA